MRDFDDVSDVSTDDENEEPGLGDDLRTIAGDDPDTDEDLDDDDVEDDEELDDTEEEPGTRNP